MLGKTLGEVGDMPWDEFLSWLEMMRLDAKAEKDAIDKARIR